jgi:Tol biopolymer transport system component
MTPILTEVRWRTLLPGQRSELRIADAETGHSEVVYSTDLSVVEAPNWSPDGRWLVFNSAGLLYRVSATGGEPQLIDTRELTDNNNDHLISRDGSTIYSSAEGDGHLYAIPFAGGEPKRISNEKSEPFGYFLQGISPDGRTLAYTGAQRRFGRDFATNLYTVPAEGGDDVALTDWDIDSVGCEYTPDGEWLLFNSEYGASARGHAQIFRMRPGGSDLQALTADERVNWFPKVSPDGTQVVFVSFPPGTIGHTANEDVVIRSMSLDGAEQRDLIRLLGGQGTMNVNSWAPDGERFAYVAYPIEKGSNE